MQVSTKLEQLYDSLVDYHFELIDQRGRAVGDHKTTLRRITNDLDVATLALLSALRDAQRNNI
jgi:hypothetical protein